MPSAPLSNMKPGGLGGGGGDSGGLDGGGGDSGFTQSTLNALAASPLVLVA